jgi:hypothetical protein
VAVRQVGEATGELRIGAMETSPRCTCRAP